MTPAERSRLLPHAAGLITAAHDPDDAANQLAAVAETLDDTATWALLVTLAAAVDPDIPLTALRPDPQLLETTERAWGRRAETVASLARRSGRDVARIAVEGRRANNRTGAA